MQIIKKTNVGTIYLHIESNVYYFINKNSKQKKGTLEQLKKHIEKLNGFEQIIL